MVRYKEQSPKLGRAALLSSVFGGVLRSFFIAACFVFLFAAAMYFSDAAFFQEYLAYSMAAILFSSVFFSSFVACYRTKAKGVLIGLSIGLMTAAAVAAIGMGFAESSGTFLLYGNKIIFSGLMGALGGMIGVNV